MRPRLARIPRSPSGLGFLPDVPGFLAAEEMPPDDKDHDYDHQRMGRDAKQTDLVYHRQLDIVQINDENHTDNREQHEKGEEAVIGIDLRVVEPEVEIGRASCRERV